ncbi:MAG: LytTR family DNA-binding domain-containing protein [Defluviitaleaceae bacterium]|nr:LytTR family DNA-binding domain-containing protein [Defluviitaleaceae bacterium]
MLSVFICEDQEEFLNRISYCISEYISTNQLDAIVKCATPSPNEILKHLQEGSALGLYFLDLDLKSSIDGFKLATEIRKYDPRAFIVICTSDADSKHLSFKYVIEVMDYITKDVDDFNERLCACVDVAYYRHMEGMGRKKLEIKVSEDIELKNKTRFLKGEFVYLDYEDILYIEVTAGRAHHITIHTIMDSYTMRGSLNKIQKSLDNQFVRCYKSCIVNVKKIQSINSSDGKVSLINGKQLCVGRSYIEQIRQTILNCAEKL